MCPGCANTLSVRGRARDPAPIAKKGTPGCRHYFCFKGPEFHKRSTGSVYFILNKKKRSASALPAPCSEWTWMLLPSEGLQGWK